MTIDKHLGRDVHGNKRAPYVPPEKHDKELLVGVPRKLNREIYNIDDNNLPFVGFDVWNAFEMSWLDKHGRPMTGILKLVYDCKSPNIVESKSLKLYLNSFNFERFNTKQDVVDCVTEDLSNTIGYDVNVFIDNDKYGFDRLVKDRLLFWDLDYVEYIEGVFDARQETPSLLDIEGEVLDNIRVTTNILRSNCKITHQPDWGRLFVWMEGDNNPSVNGLYSYITSFRRENHFHEEVCEMIYTRLNARNPRKLAVGCFYTRRGGIDINSIRASDENVLSNFVEEIENESA